MNTPPTLWHKRALCFALEVPHATFQAWVEIGLVHPTEAEKASAEEPEEPGAFFDERGLLEAVAAQEMSRVGLDPEHIERGVAHLRETPPHLYPSVFLVFFGDVVQVKEASWNWGLLMEERWRGEHVLIFPIGEKYYRARRLLEGGPRPMRRYVDPHNPNIVTIIG